MHNLVLHYLMHLRIIISSKQQKARADCRHHTRAFHRNEVIMQQNNLANQLQKAEPKPSIGKGALILCSFILAVSFIYFALVQADREQTNHDLAIANARAQLAELNAQEAVQRKGVNF